MKNLEIESEFWDLFFKDQYGLYEIDINAYSIIGLKTKKIILIEDNTAYDYIIKKMKDEGYTIIKDISFLNSA